eukprot:4548782-Lingulodinium_polyedra.AAC.1
MLEARADLVFVVLAPAEPRLARHLPPRAHVHRVDPPHRQGVTGAPQLRAVEQLGVHERAHQ